MGEATTSTDPVPTLPSAPPIVISPHLTLQPPLSRRGTGPGLILVLNNWSLQGNKSDASEGLEKTLDPPPLTKWAEEGYAVAQVLVPGKPEEFPLKKAIEELRKLDGFEEGKGIGLISYLSRIPFYVEEGAYASPEIKAVISYNGKKFNTINPESHPIPQLLHIPGHTAPRRESVSIVPEAESSKASIASQANIKSFRYVDAKPDTTWVLPADDDYHAGSANLSHSRSLAWLKPLLGGPWFDLEAVWEEHTKYEFGERSVERTMATMVAEPYVNHIPTMTGGVGREALTEFYTNNFIHANPDDTALELVSRTVGIDRVVDEFVFTCTHDRQIEWLLPGIPPTGNKLAIPFTAIINVRGDRLYHEHIHWDQATALRQVGILPEYLPFPYPIGGSDGSFEVRVPTAGVETAKKLVNSEDGESNTLIKEGGVRSFRT